MAERGSQILIFSPHGGGIEIGASELVEAIAGKGLSYYLFEGLRANGNDLLHITSTRFDELGCLRMLSRAALTAGGFKAQRGDGHLAGRYAKNICNRTRSGKGCQLELSTALRRALFVDYSTRRGRERKTALFEKLVTVIRGVILDEG